MNQRVGESMHASMDGLIDGQWKITCWIDGKVDEWMDRWMMHDRWINWFVDGQIDGWVVR